MQFGNYDCAAVIIDSFLLDGGAMFGAVPKVLWEKKIAADAKNRISMKARSLLIRGNGKVILIDTGIGEKLPEKFKSIYRVEPAGDSMDARLSHFGVKSGDVTDVIITHLHFDHCGGSTLFENASLVPAFPNAVYHLQIRQWEFAMDPPVRDRSSYIADNYMPLYEQKVLNLIDGEVELFDGIKMFVTDGHTPGQQHPLITGESSSLFFCADLIPTAAHIPLSWNMSYDNFPLTIINEKEEILRQAVEENWILCFEHDPKIPAATLKRENGNIMMDQVVTL